MSSRPQTPTYSKARPLGNEFCTSCQGDRINIVSSSSGGKPVSVLSGVDIDVNDLSTSSESVFVVNYSPYVGLQASLTLIAKVSGVAQNMPILKGTVVDAIELDWSYNKVVASQTLTNNGGLAVPTLDDADRSYDYSGQAISNTVSITLQGDDGQGRSGSVDTEVKTVSFGNYFVHGAGADKIGGATTSLQALYDALGNKTIKTSRTNTIFPEGGTNEYHFVIYPKSWGLATFKKGIFVGGYARLKNVAGVLKITVESGESESDIILSNGNGFSEAHYIYQSINDLQEDNVTPVEVS